MADPGEHGGVVWQNHIALPEANLTLYQEIYELEVWLRRIALAALLLTYGSAWPDRLPPEIAARAKQSLAQLRRRVYLDCERSDNAVWVLTFEDLNRLLMSNELWPNVHRLTEANRTQLSARLDEIREIRNVVAHNRAAAERTLLIFRDSASLIQDGIDQFRWLLDLPYARLDRPTLYSTSASRQGDDFVAAAVRARTPSGSPSFLCERSELFHKLTQILEEQTVALTCCLTP
jgi:hypothetical protein